MIYSIIKIFFKNHLQHSKNPSGVLKICCIWGGGLVAVKSNLECVTNYILMPSSFKKK